MAGGGRWRMGLRQGVAQEWPELWITNEYILPLKVEVLLNSRQEWWARIWNSHCQSNFLKKTASEEATHYRNAPWAFGAWYNLKFYKHSASQKKYTSQANVALWSPGQHLWWGCWLITRIHNPAFLGTQLNYSSPSSLELGMNQWLGSSQWDGSRKNMCLWGANTLKQLLGPLLLFVHLCLWGAGHEATVELQWRSSLGPGPHMEDSLQLLGVQLWKANICSWNSFSIWGPINYCNLALLI
jgi:hypothetical protein